MDEILITFFKKVAKKDKTEFNHLKKSKYFQTKSDRCCFTLPKLFLYLQENNYINHEVEYKQFRQKLYSCPINYHLKNMRAEIVVSKNNSNVDRSLYCLIWKQ